MKTNQEASPRFHRSALSDDVYDYLRKEIIEGRLEPGARVVEEKLATDLGMSRAPLREAILHLRRDGLVSGTGRDTRIIELSPTDIRELHLMRATLETLAYQSAARYLTDKDIAGLRDLIESMRAVDAGQAGKMKELDYEFHQRLCRLSGIQRLYDAWRDQKVLFGMWLTVAGNAREDAEYLAEQHARLLDVVIAGDPRDIANEVTHHIYEVGSALAAERELWDEDRSLLLGELPPRT
ncbi:GntR family transcriptional regulator [Arthrobacter sp. NPDC080031]|uniref:GntR family transcriptional regulator n=1 Tax=Arthrobacter sp. NPDC080031 TaxID=3155918 RepID=UPI00344E9A33